MKLQSHQLERDPLAELGALAANLLQDRRFDELAGTFDYGEAHDRPAARALEEDLRWKLAEAGATAVKFRSIEDVSVGYFEKNSTRLFAVVECPFDTDSGGTGDLSLIVIHGTDNEYHMAIEDFTAWPPEGMAARARQ